MKKTTKIIIVLLIVIIAGITVVTSIKHAADDPSQSSAEKAAMAYAEAIDYQYENPAVIYEFMTDDFRKVMDKSEFIQAFKKERSYPYLTPLFINYDRVELNEDGTTGTAYYSQAARLPGMVYEVGLVYEDSHWHIKDFDDFLDGSYLDKFDTVTYDLKSYFDTEQAYPEEKETESETE